MGNRINYIYFWSSNFFVDCIFYIINCAKERVISKFIITSVYIPHVSRSNGSKTDKSYPITPHYASIRSITFSNS